MVMLGGYCLRGVGLSKELSFICERKGSYTDVSSVCNVHVCNRLVCETQWIVPSTQVCIFKM